MKYLREPLADDISEIIDDKTAAKEALMLGLRMMAGLDLATWPKNTVWICWWIAAQRIKMMQDEGLVQLSDGKLRLTQSGIPISNSIIATLI